MYTQGNPADCSPDTQNKLNSWDVFSACRSIGWWGRSPLHFWLAHHDSTWFHAAYCVGTKKKTAGFNREERHFARVMCETVPCCWLVESLESEDDNHPQMVIILHVDENDNDTASCQSVVLAATAG